MAVTVVGIGVESCLRNGTGRDSYAWGCSSGHIGNIVIVLLSLAVVLVVMVMLAMVVPIVPLLLLLLLLPIFISLEWMLAWIDWVWSFNVNKTDPKLFKRQIIWLDPLKINNNNKKLLDLWTECDNQPTDGRDETRMHKEITTNRDKKKTKIEVRECLRL